MSRKNNLNIRDEDVPPEPENGSMRHAHASDVQDILPVLASAGNETTGHRKVRRRRRGRRKKHPREKENWMPNAFGKYPMSSSVKKFLNATKKYYAPSTQKERSRKLRYICRVLVTELKAPRSPQNITEKDIIKFIDWMDKKKLVGATKRRLIRYLRDYLSYYDNDIVYKLLRKKQIRVPKEMPPEVRTLSESDVKAIHEAAKGMKGWKGAVARFITLAYPYTGLRPSELRTLKYRDVDMETWTLRVSHPKGEGLYGKHRRVGILPQARQAFSDFMVEREKYLLENGETVDFEALIPYKGRYGLEYWGYCQLGNLKREIEEKAGIRFKIKDYRSTFCQLGIDRGANLQAISKVMGHKTTETTETYYGRIRDDRAIDEVERAFLKPALEV